MQKGCQPIRSLDTANPPQGRSGVPEALYLPGFEDLRPNEIVPETEVTKPDIIKSISFDQVEILRNIIQLHTGPIECDVTFGSGCFYKKLDRPPLCFDIAPRKDGVIQADCCHLPLPNQSVESIMFDPPFLPRTGPGSIIKSQFGAIDGGIAGLKHFYFLSMTETYRVLKDQGYLVFKCQDLVSGGKNHFIHCDVRDMALSIGFECIDLFILNVHRRMPDPQGRAQKHARKFHSFFFVFQKPKKKRMLH